MWIEQLARYILVMEHILASPAVWLIAGITALERLFVLMYGSEQTSLMSMLTVVLTFYLGTGVFFAFSKGEFRVTTLMAARRAHQVILPVIFLSFKMALLWFIPLVVIAMAVAGFKDNIVITTIVSGLIISCMMISFILVTAAAMHKERYHVIEILKALTANLTPLLQQTLLPMLLCLGAFLLSAFAGPESSWGVAVSPVTILCEYAYFLYVIGTFSTHPSLLKESI